MDLATAQPLSWTITIDTNIPAAMHVRGYILGCVSLIIPGHKLPVVLLTVKQVVVGVMAPSNHAHCTNHNPYADNTLVIPAAEKKNATATCTIRTTSRVAP